MLTSATPTCPNWVTARNRDRRTQTTLHHSRPVTGAFVNVSETVSLFCQTRPKKEKKKKKKRDQAANLDFATKTVRRMGVAQCQTELSASRRAG